MPVHQRLRSLDVFRGLTIMLMIIVNTPGSSEHTYYMLEHAPWTGCTLADLVFPFFLFSVGFAGFLSCRKYDWQLNSPQAHKILLRTVKLFLLGIIFNTFPFFDPGAGLSISSVTTAWSHVRIFGILQRIACAYCLGILSCLVLQSARRIIFAAAGLLIIHTSGLMLYAPAAPFGLEHNLSQAIDIFLVGDIHLYHDFGIPFDPEGLYGTLSAAASVMIGYLAGMWMLRGIKVACYLYRGILLCMGGLLLSWYLPVCKALWTMSYVLLTSGAALLLIGTLIYIENNAVWARHVFQPLQAFGANAIFFFFASAFLAQTCGLLWLDAVGASVYDWFYEQLFLPFFVPETASLVFSCSYLLFCMLIAELLYRKRIFLKI